MKGPIACLDIDYFFAQAEELRNPVLKSKPVIVCVYSHRTADSGAVATSNYVARRFGVKSGMPIRMAKEILKSVDAVFLPMDKKYYSELSSKVFQIVEKYVDAIERASIDEAFMDISGVSQGSFDAAETIMKSLKLEIREKTGLSCSIGVAKNKLLAKMAADDAKPDGLMVIRPGSESDFLGPKRVEEIPFVGRKTAKVLNEMGVKTVRDLAEVSVERLIAEFGFKVGQFLYLASRGEYSSHVVPKVKSKQMSRMITLKRNSRDEDEIWKQLEGAVLELHERILEEKYGFRGVSVIGVTTAMKLISRSLTLPQYTGELGDLVGASRHLLRELLEDFREELRRVGIRVFELSSVRGQSRLTDF